MPRALWIALAVAMAAAGPLDRARSLISSRNFSEARTELERVLKAEPRNAEAHRLLGAVLLDLDQTGPAIEHLRAGGDRNLLARALLIANRLTEARAVLEALTKEQPSDAASWGLLGRLHENSGRPRDAVEPLRRALKGNAGDVAARVALANAYYALGRTEEAGREFAEAVKRNASGPRPLADAHASYAIFLLRTGRVEEAAGQARAARAINPASAMAREAARALERRRPAAEAKTFGARDPVFEDVAEAAGIRFRVENSPTPEKRQIETMPGGVAVFDFNDDGRQDIYFTNGAESPGLKKSSPKYWNRLYRNDGGWKFTDVTEAAGVAGDGYDMGAAAGDYDGDGHTDLFVAGVRGVKLYRNLGDGRFRDVAEAAGLTRPHPEYGRMWAIHAVWFDYDGDGRLDLLVVNYCRWDPAREPDCSEGSGIRSYCHPRFYGPLPNQLFRNNGDGTFTDVSAAAGIGKHLGKGMGAAAADFDGDGRPDVFVANDTVPNFLFRNRGDGTFEEVGLARGVAYNQFGNALSSMGAEFRDVDNDGSPDLFVTTLSNEGFLLFANRGGHFEDASDPSRVTAASLPWSGWSNAIADFNNDGWKDLFSANGHAIDNIELVQNREYKQPNLLLVQEGPLRFREAKLPARREAYRGMAAADFDDDGRLDVVVTALGAPAALLRNVTAPVGHWLKIALRGRAAGAVVTALLSDGRTLTDTVQLGSGYASAHDARVHFGLGEARVERIEVRWPSGKKQTVAAPGRDAVVVAAEPR